MKKWTKSCILVSIASIWLFSPVFPQETPVENPSPYAGGGIRSTIADYILQKEAAVKYYQKAMELESKLPEVKRILQKLRTKREV
jgi:hypothetical protein